MSEVGTAMCVCGHDAFVHVGVKGNLGCGVHNCGCLEFRLRTRAPKLVPCDAEELTLP